MGIVDQAERDYAARLQNIEMFDPHRSFRQDSSLERGLALASGPQLSNDISSESVGVIPTVSMTRRPGRTFRTVNISKCVESGPGWLVQGLIEQGAVSAISGPPGSGKSFLLVDLAGHVASGRSWFGRKVLKGAVIYIAAESSTSTERRAALARRVKFGPVELPLKIVQEPVLLGDDVVSASHRHALESLVADTTAEFGLPVVLIIFDTVAASMGNGDENLAGMQRLVGAANLLAVNTRAAVVLNHHPSAGGNALRGHGSLLGTVSHAFQIELKGDVRAVKAFKQRDAASGPLFAYRLRAYDLGTPDNFGDRATSCVVEQTDISNEEGGRSESSESTRLQLAVREGFAAKGASVETMRFADILTACQQRCEFLEFKSAETIRKAVARAINTLIAAGVVIPCSVSRGAYRLAGRERQGSGLPVGHGT
jgi:hypothetical protein